jgi:hypothetical protein
MFTSFLCAMSFAFTQTPLIYAFRVMTCDEYYKTHSYGGVGDRCALPRIEADTASSVALVGTSTMFFSKEGIDSGLTSSDYQRVRDRLVDQAVRCQGSHVPADRLGRSSQSYANIRPDYRWSDGYHHHPGDAGV